MGRGGQNIRYSGSLVGAQAQRDDILEVIVTPYRVIYRRRSGAVEIIALRYGAREFSGRELA